MSDRQAGDGVGAWESSPICRRLFQKSRKRFLGGCHAYRHELSLCR
jgi:hypothetical protein